MVDFSIQVYSFANHVYSLNCGGISTNTARVMTSSLNQGWGVGELSYKGHRFRRTRR